MDILKTSHNSCTSGVAQQTGAQNGRIALTRPTRLAALALATALCTLAPMSYAQSSNNNLSGEDTAARLSYEEAGRAESAGDLLRALKLYQHAWSLHPGYDIAAALGDVELRLQHFADAARHLQYAAEHLPLTEDPQFGDLIRERLRTAKESVCQVELGGLPPKSKVWLDGAVTQLPFFVVPGNHVLKIETEEGLTDTQEFFARPGTRQRIELKLSEPPSAKPAPAPSPAETELVAKHQDWILWTGGAVTALAFAGGIYAYSVAKETDASGSEDCQLEPKGGGCGDSIEQYNTARDWNHGLLWGGAAMGVTTLLTYLIWTEEEVPIRASVTQDGAFGAFRIRF